MLEVKGESILRCPLCTKPFDKQATLKRHGYYCRSRKIGTSTRPRSCIACAKSKARCDNRRSGCSRCIGKGVECRYPADKPNGARREAQDIDDATHEKRNVVPSSAPDAFHDGDSQESIDSIDIPLDDVSGTSDSPLELNNPEKRPFDFDYTHVDFSQFLDSETNDKAVQHTPSNLSKLSYNSTPSTDGMARLLPLDFAPHSIIPQAPSYPPRALAKRHRPRYGSQRTADLIVHTLRSYPLMVLRDNTLPPFIHPHVMSSNFGNDNMEPLTNCTSLVHMISGETKGSRKLFWKNVQLECERLCAEYTNFNKWQLLASMQALSIYVLIRLQEGETDHNNVDFMLITTVVVTASQLACINLTSITDSASPNRDLRSSWTDWLFEESRRRLCMVYQITNMLIYFEPAAMCEHPTGLILAPLPARKQLWESGDALAWKTESERRYQADYGLATSGELVELDPGTYCEDSALLHNFSDGVSCIRRTVDWEEWCAGVDSFGGLIMLAASLIK